MVLITVFTESLHVVLLMECFGAVYLFLFGLFLR